MTAATRTLYLRQNLWERVDTWLVQIPLLVYAVHGSFSLFSPGNGALAVVSAGLMNTGKEAAGTGVVLHITALLAILIMLPLARRTFKLMQANAYVSGILILATASFLWSQDPVQSLQKSAYLIITTFFAFYLTEQFTSRQIMRLLILTGTVAMVSSLVFVVALPKYGLFTGAVDEASGWEGIFSHKNVLGLMMVYFISPALFLPTAGPRSRLFRGLYLALGLFLIIMSRSRGAWIMCGSLFFFSAVIVLGRRMRGRQRVALYYGLGLSFLLAAFVIYSNLEPLLRLIGKDMTLTGRTRIWDVLLSSLSHRFLLGYGYSAFWIGLKGESAAVIFAMNWPSIGYAENGILELGLELGVVGIALFIMAYIQGYSRLKRLMTHARSSPELFWFASLHFLAAITNIEAGTIAYANSMEWLMFVIVTPSLQKRYQELYNPALDAYAKSSQ